MKIDDVILDEFAGRARPEVEHERQTAVADLLAHNLFKLHGPTLSGALPKAWEGPYRLILSVIDGRIVFDIRNLDDTHLTKVSVSVRPFRSIIRDYFIICESYYDALTSPSAARIETLDMGRRGIHNEGAQMLRDRLAAHVMCDQDTARRLFTLVCVLHIKGRWQTTIPARRAADPPSPKKETSAQATGKKRILFACTMNAVRSPIAECVAKSIFGDQLEIESAGIEAKEIDPFAQNIMKERGIDAADHKSKKLDNLTDKRFDIFVALSPDACPEIRRLARHQGAKLLIWNIDDPTTTSGHREQVMDAYRRVFEQISAKIKVELLPLIES